MYVSWHSRTFFFRRLTIIKTRKTDTHITRKRRTNVKPKTIFGSQLSVYGTSEVAVAGVVVFQTTKVSPVFCGKNVSVCEEVPSQTLSDSVVQTLFVDLLILPQTVHGMQSPSTFPSLKVFPNSHATHSPKHLLDLPNPLTQDVQFRNSVSFRETLATVKIYSGSLSPLEKSPISPEEKPSSRMFSK